jgi:hypothetical protein
MAVPGDVNIINCQIISPRGSLDLTSSFLSGKVYESIMVPNAVVEIDVLDTNDALGNLNIIGDETINFSFNAPGTPVLSYVFALDKPVLNSIEGTQKAKNYTLHGVGKEALQAKTNYIQKAYNTDIASIISDIHTTFLKSVNPIVTEATSGIQKIIIPNLKPFDAIDMVRRRATSATNQSSTFLYFENADGHNFKTIEGMTKQGVVKTFVHQDAVGSSIYINTYNNIIHYEVPQIASSGQRIGLGGLTQRISTYDVRTRQYVSTDQQLNLGNFNSSLFKSVYGAVYGLFSMIPQDSAGRAGTNIPSTTPLQMAYVSNLMQIQLNMRVFGDTAVKAGDMIAANIPQAIDNTGSVQLDPQLSGNYLVSRLCRNIDVIGKTPRYTESLECLTPNLATGV